MAVSDWSATASENTAVGGVNIAEGCPAKGLNNAIREVMAAVKTRDGQVVHTSGDETIGGTKTFSSPISGDVTGNAGTADKLKTARTLAVSDADASNTGQAQSFDGSGNATLPLPATIKADIVGDLTGDVTGYVTGYVTGNLTGNVTGNVTGDLTGNADTATKLATARTITLSGDVSGSASFDGSSDVTIQATASDNAYLHTSGNETATGVKTLTGQLNANGGIKINNLEVIAVENNAGAHNGIYRGKDLTNVYTLAQLHSKLDQGDFSDLYIGDYITKTFTNPAGNSETMDFVFAAFDYWLHSGGSGTYTRYQGYTLANAECTFHHILMVPRDCFVTLAQMNSSNTTEGAYIGSAMNETCKTYATKLSASNVFGDYIKPFANWENGKVNVDAYSAAGANIKGSTIFFNNSQSGYDWAVHKVRLMNEVMVYGANVFSSSGYETGCCKSQLPLFRLRPDTIRCGKGLGGARQTYWLSSVVSSAHFANVYNNGIANNNSASNSYGVRPFFLIG